MSAPTRRQTRSRRFGPTGWLATMVLLAPAEAALGELRFRDAVEAWGLVFQHHNGSSGRHYQPETDGSGVVVFDYDGDGDQDVFFVDSGALPGYQGEKPRSVLYRNDGTVFQERTIEAGLQVTGYGMGATAGDYDGDGDPDLYVTAFGKNQLFENNGDGSFSDVTEESGTGDDRWSSSAAFADPDGDGDLDLYVVNYLAWKLEDQRTCRDPASGITSYCHPDLFAGDLDRFYRNRGDKTFEDATLSAGFTDPSGKGLGLVFADFDNDTWPDLYVANDMTPNFLFRNRGNGVFEDLSLLSGTALSDRSIPEAGMGVAVGDVTGNGLLDLFVTNYALETNALYRNLGDSLFSDLRHLSGIAEPSIPLLGFGTAFADFDQDGDLDLAVANGHVLDTVEKLHPGLTYAQRNQIFEQTATGRFLEAEAAGLDQIRVSRGLASGDLDGDGDLDLLITNSNGPAEVYENTSKSGNWIAVTLSGAGSNTAGVGARAAIGEAADLQVREARTSSSYLSQNASSLHFGLAGRRRVDLSLRWPGGASTRYLDLPANRELRLYQRPALRARDDQAAIDR